MISLPKFYYLVINDRFELFYRGVIRKHNPYEYYVKATCDKGYTYNRYFTYTPKEDELGEYKLTISLFDDEGNVIESKDTVLKVVKTIDLPKKANILCLGDSLTTNGVWPYVGYTKYESLNPGMLNFIGKMKKEDIGYEGYGGWQWKTFCTDHNNSPTSSVWVKTNHHLTEDDQHSIWKSLDKEWIVETIVPGKIKFKRGKNNFGIGQKVGTKFEHVLHGIHIEDIEVLEYEYSDGNPFWNSAIEDIDFLNYLQVNNLPEFDYVFILLTWNGQYIPYNKDISIHESSLYKIIRTIHKELPKTKIVFMGIPLPCPNGGITACYGANGYYHDWYGETITAFNYNEWLEKISYLEEFNDYIDYVDIKSQFDSEYSFSVKMMPVNNRSEIQERIGVNGIHPSLNGYNQIGDAFFRALVGTLNKYK